MYDQQVYNMKDKYCTCIWVYLEGLRHIKYEYNLCEWLQIRTPGLIDKWKRLRHSAKVNLLEFQRRTFTVISMPDIVDKWDAL